MYIIKTKKDYGVQHYFILGEELTNIEYHDGETFDTGLFQNDEGTVQWVELRDVELIEE